MKIDNYEPQVYNFGNSLKSSADAQFNSITHLYVGMNETMTEGFVGCLNTLKSRFYVKSSPIQKMLGSNG